MVQFLEWEDQIKEVENGLEITRTSSFTNKRNTMTLPITRETYNSWRFGGALIQNAFPGLSPEQREFMMTGCTSEEWADVFDDLEDEEEEED